MLKTNFKNEKLFMYRSGNKNEEKGDERERER
jgi:hypothetical protein